MLQVYRELNQGGGDHLFVYDVQDHTRTKIAELDYTHNEDITGKTEFDKKKTFSCAGNHSLLVHFSTDSVLSWRGFSAVIHFIPINTNCSYFFNETDLILNKVIDCNWVITAPSMTNTIIVQFQYFQVCTIPKLVVLVNLLSSC